MNQVDEGQAQEQDNLGGAGVIEWGDAALIESVPEPFCEEMESEDNLEGACAEIPELAMCRNPGIRSKARKRVNQSCSVA